MPYDEYVKARQHQFEKQRQMALADKREKQIRDEKYRRLYQSVDHALQTITRQAPAAAKNLKDKMHTVKAMEKCFDRADAQMTRLPEQEEAIFFRQGGESAKMPAGKTVIS